MMTQKRVDELEIKGKVKNRGKKLEFQGITAESERELECAREELKIAECKVDELKGKLYSCE